MEHLWEELREKHLPNKACESLDAVGKALCKELRDLHADPDKVSSMTKLASTHLTR